MTNTPPTGDLTVDVVTGIADHAASQSDRWLFVALLIFGILSAVVMVKWFLSDRTKMGDRLTAVTDRHIETVGKLSEVVANNTIALNRNTEVLESCRARMRGQV